MKYILNRQFLLRGWYKAPTGLYDTQQKEARFFTKEEYLLLMRCDGAHEMDTAALGEDEQSFLEWLKEERIIREAGFLDFLTQKQRYRTFPARYRKHVQWSITGACNLKCRHCFMSAPHSKHGSPTKEQLLSVADQLAECGVFSVGITGGEPLVRGDLFEIVDALAKREISVSTIYTNGWLVDETLLDRLEERKIRPGFQLSFDGIGRHDFLRGIPGAEEKTVAAIRLLKERGYHVAVAVSMHRKNRSVLRETVRFLASLGVESVKCGVMMDLGEWSSPEVRDLHLSREEELEMYEEYIPQYFEDDAPVPIMLADTLTYTPGDPAFRLCEVRHVAKEEEAAAPSCGVVNQNFYIGADGMVAPCMGMCDCGFASHFPNLFETPLREILRDSEFLTLCAVTVKDIRDHNPKCRECAYVDRCTGGCRNSVLMQGDDYYGIDENLCYFYENGWEERLTKAAEKPFAAYLKRNPPMKKAEPSAFAETGEDCP
ncbi:MAG: radical SAM protein [Oscillospiraceae bacterium]|nr:radical SAM protein [Oscillospiraceae bacterium]